MKASIVIIPLLLHPRCGVLPPVSSCLVSSHFQSQPDILVCYFRLHWYFCPYLLTGLQRNIEMKLTGAQRDEQLGSNPRYKVMSRRHIVLTLRNIQSALTVAVWLIFRTLPLQSFIRPPIVVTSTQKK